MSQLEKALVSIIRIVQVCGLGLIAIFLILLVASFSGCSPKLAPAGTQTKFVEFDPKQAEKGRRIHQRTIRRFQRHFHTPWRPRA